MVLCTCNVIEIIACNIFTADHLFILCGFFLRVLAKHDVHCFRLMSFATVILQSYFPSLYRKNASLSVLLFSVWFILTSTKVANNQRRRQKKTGNAFVCVGQMFARRYQILGILCKWRCKTSKCLFINMNSVQANRLCKRCQHETKYNVDSISQPKKSFSK